MQHHIYKYKSAFATNISTHTKPHHFTNTPITMATISSQNSLLLLLLLLAAASAAFAQPSFRPRALVAPVRKDPSTLQYVTRLGQRSPLVPISLVLDLGGQFLWVDCDSNYASSTYRPARCRSAQCSLANAGGCGDCFSSPPRPGCNNNTCGVLPDNTVTRTATSGELADDALSLHSTDGSNPGRNATAPRFLFSCAPTSLLQGLAPVASGMAGLGRTRIALPSQLASAFSFRRKFAICLSTSADGVVFFGDGPYVFLPGRDISGDSLTYTPLFLNPVSTASAFSQGDASTEYFIGVKSIRVNDRVTVPVNATLLSIDPQSGIGGTKISTVNPYTVLESSIFEALGKVYTEEAAAMNMSRAAAVAPFKFCFSGEGVAGTRVGPAVPSIELVLQGAVWRMFGANSMARVGGGGVLCLAVVDGGAEARTSIVMGGYQLEDNLLQFDLAASMLGFSSTLLGRQTNCANFNFTSNVA